MFLVIANAIHIFPQTNKTCYMKKSQKTINKNSDMVEIKIKNKNLKMKTPDLIKIPQSFFVV